MVFGHEMGTCHVIDVRYPNGLALVLHSVALVFFCMNQTKGGHVRMRLPGTDVSMATNFIL